MKLLSINYSFITSSSDNVDIVESKLDLSTPFGYDVVLVDPETVSALTHGKKYTAAFARWRAFIEKYLNQGNPLFVLSRPASSETDPYTHSSINNYHWINIDLASDKFSSIGASEHIGMVTAKDKNLKRYLLEAKHSIRSYYRAKDEKDQFEVLSKIDDEFITSFRVKTSTSTVTFLPYTEDEDILLRLISSYGSPTARWDIKETEVLKGKIEKIDKKINSLSDEKDELEEELNKSQKSLEETISNDVYLTRAIAAIDRAKHDPSPNPEDFYECIENIERAFDSEHEMREKLDVPKSFIDKVMRRTNQFRHAQKEGKEPDPLSKDEISDFINRCERVISYYLQFTTNKIS